MLNTIPLSKITTESFASYFFNSGAATAACNWKMLAPDSKREPDLNREGILESITSNTPNLLYSEFVGTTLDVILYEHLGSLTEPAEVKIELGANGSFSDVVKHLLSHHLRLVCLEELQEQDIDPSRHADLETNLIAHIKVDRDEMLSLLYQDVIDVLEELNVEVAQRYFGVLMFEGESLNIVLSLEQAIRLTEELDL